ncbi:DUF1080 domain-containing protein [Opitutales bacterium]|nr:DUF1080 domain-containing protein [Opitutales bacterium]
MKLKAIHSILLRLGLCIVLSLCMLSCLPEKMLPSSLIDNKRWLFDGSSLEDWEPTDFAGKGEVMIDANGSLVLEMGAELSGVHWKGEPLPVVNYEIHFKAKRTMGSDFFCGLTFPFKQSHATLILGGWGGSLIGISSIDDFDASENETGDAYIFEDNQWYDIRLRATDSEISVWINDEQVIDCEVEGRKVAMRYGEIEMSVPLGICTYATTGVIREVFLKEI